jgi:hypothetical protein
VGTRLDYWHSVLFQARKARVALVALAEAGEPSGCDSAAFMYNFIKFTGLSVHAGNSRHYVRTDSQTPGRR